MSDATRREFLRQLAVAAGGVVLMPVVSACTTAVPKPEEDAVKDAAKDVKEEVKEEAKDAAMAALPTAKPEGWDPVAFNKARGNAGAIPDTYLPSINGEDGVAKHLGKHLPYVPKLPDASVVPAGFLAIMWGDPEKGYAKHPNAPTSEANPKGHWYDWIKIRKAVDGEAEELQSAYSSWPGTGEGDSGAYAVFGGGEITAEGGKNTVYLAALPKDVGPGDTIRVWAHCLTHGEYVDFITLA